MRKSVSLPQADGGPPDPPALSLDPPAPAAAPALVQRLETGLVDALEQYGPARTLVTAARLAL